MVHYDMNDNKQRNKSLYLLPHDYLILLCIADNEGCLKILCS